MANVTSLLTSLCTKFDDLGNSNQTSSSNSLPSNTIPNPRNEAKAITMYTEDIQPPPLIHEQTKDKEPIKEPSFVANKAKPNLPYPSRLNKEKIREKDDILASKFMEIFRNLHFELSFADALILCQVCFRCAQKMLNNKDKLIELTKTPLMKIDSAVVLKKLPEKLDKDIIEVDKAKVDVISKLPHPTTVKGIRSFLGHSEDCILAFSNIEKVMLTESSNFIAPNWDHPLLKSCTDKSKITRKQSKAGKHGHENQEEYKALANFLLQGPFLHFSKVIYNLRERKERQGPNVQSHQRSTVLTVKEEAGNPFTIHPSSPISLLCLYEDMERFKGLLRQCPHLGFSELTNSILYYISLNSNDSRCYLDSAAGGNFLDKMPQEGLAIIESKSKVCYSRSRANDSRKYSRFTGFSDSVAYNNPSPHFDPIVSTSSPTLTPFDESDFLLFEERPLLFIAIDDEPVSPVFNATYYDPEGDILILEALLNNDPLPSPDQGDYFPGIQKDLKVVEPKESSLEPKDEIPEVELKELPPHLEYAFLEENNKLPVIISKDLKPRRKDSLFLYFKNRKTSNCLELSESEA
ncbi:hypothetical protein Tco_1530561 [Tanacetum coccineum]